MSVQQRTSKHDQHDYVNGDDGDTIGQDIIERKRTLQRCWKQQKQVGVRTGTASGARSSHTETNTTGRRAASQCDRCPSKLPPSPAAYEQGPRTPVHCANILPPRSGGRRPSFARESEGKAITTFRTPSVFGRIRQPVTEAELCQGACCKIMMTSMMTL